ncbi:MAG: hypothetical protein WCK53_10640 [Methanomicrobiales archaeon]
MTPDILNYTTAPPPTVTEKGPTVPALATCLYCGTPIHPDRKTQKYCGSICRNKAWMDREKEAGRTRGQKRNEVNGQEITTPAKAITPKEPTQAELNEVRVYVPKISDSPPPPVPAPGVPTKATREDLLDLIDNFWNMAEDETALIGLILERDPDIETDDIKRAINEREREINHNTSIRVPAPVSVWEEGASNCELSYWNLPEKGIVARTNKVPVSGKATQRDDLIVSYYIRDVTKHSNPITPSEVSYSVTLVSAKKRGQTIPYEERELSDITSDLAGNQPGVRSRTKVHEAVSSLIDQLEIENKIKYKASIPATGIFEDEKGRAYLSNWREYKTHLPEYKPVETRKALKFLDEVMTFYAVGDDPAQEGACDHCLIPLYFMVSGPLSVVKKLAGGEVKILLLTGTPHTGKTILEKINSYIWGLPLEQSVIGAAKLSAPQLATHLSKTTFPLALDEVRNILSVPGIADLLKSSTTSLLIKERILAKKGFKKQAFYAYAPLILSCNYLPELYTGIPERLIPVTFTKRYKKTEEKAKAFDTRLNQEKERLSHIGAALINMYTSPLKWPGIKRLITVNDQVKAGYEILHLLYQGQGLPDPVWLREVAVTHDLPEVDPVLEAVNFMRVDILQTLRQHLKPDYFPDTWPLRLDQLKARHLLPPYIVNISSTRITVNNKLLAGMAKKGVEVPGGLTGLLDYLNPLEKQRSKLQETAAYKGQKVVYIDRDVFYEYAEVPEDYQEKIPE